MRFRIVRSPSQHLKVMTELMQVFQENQVRDIHFLAKTHQLAMLLRCIKDGSRHLMKQLKVGREGGPVD